MVSEIATKDESSGLYKYEIIEDKLVEGVVQGEHTMVYVTPAAPCFYGKEEYRRDCRAQEIEEEIEERKRTKKSDTQSNTRTKKRTKKSARDERKRRVDGEVQSQLCRDDIKIHA